MTDSVYKPTTATIAVDAWPTLVNMIEGGGRVVVFMDYAADYSSVSWIMDGSLSFPTDQREIAFISLLNDNRVQQHVGGCVRCNNSRLLMQRQPNFRFPFDHPLYDQPFLGQLRQYPWYQRLGA